MRNGGKLTAATELDVEYRTLHHHFDLNIYQNQVFLITTTRGMTASN
ncbi:MAG: hypothetical protein V8S58_06630 [Lachnospiraceae bacterium]